MKIEGAASNLEIDNNFLHYSKLPESHQRCKFNTKKRLSHQLLHVSYKSKEKYFHYINLFLQRWQFVYVTKFTPLQSYSINVFFKVPLKFIISFEPWFRGILQIKQPMPPNHGTIFGLVIGILWSFNIRLITLHLYHIQDQTSMALT